MSTVASALMIHPSCRTLERESGTARLEEAVAAYRDALKQWTRERVPLQWATTQSWECVDEPRRAGERHSAAGEAVAAHRGALKEWTRERVPLDWFDRNQHRW